MNKVSFFRSIHFKFTLIYVLLIIVAMQIIGVYFVNEMEKSLLKSYNDSLDQRVNNLSYYLEQEMTKDRSTSSSSTLKEDAERILNDFSKEGEILEVSLIDKSYEVIATSNPYNREVAGKKTTEGIIKRTLLVGIPYENKFFDPERDSKVRISVTPIKKSNQETIGAIYVVASMDNVYNQIRTINTILASGTFIALGITAFLGIFVARTITHPLSDMRKQAIELAKGNFSRKVRKYGNDEIGQLATTFNYLTRELKEAQSMTEGERKKLSSVIAYMTDGVIATNRNGAIILLNTPALELLNVSRETALEMPITSLLGLEDEYTFEDLVEQQDSLLLEIEQEERTSVLRVNFSVIQKEHGKIDGLIAVIYDVTEQEQIDQERREFVANVSHELRTPLTTMRSYLEALAEGAWQDPNIAPRFLNVTQNETERMIRLVNDLLQLSKFDSKDYQFNKEWIHFIRFFSLIIERFEMTKEQHVEFISNLPDRELYVEIDPDKITQVLDNIISNALKYSPEGGHITFSVDVNEEEELLYVSVKDEGVGIPRKDVEKIFERFYRVDKARTRRLGGTGLGLAIAKEMVQAHGGDIWADSIEGKGTTITFTLPYKEEQEDDWDEA
ncbi:cell wall metabolism sensor histidine kinase WalK [Bacillus sp. GM2]|jgi:two-component system sensor histidine kinase VicK|uniref:histidine kinase n=4 Tax=Bacillus licheniformis TaxID=1402 RepID=A0A1Y0YM80_BACLI|nr:MULTISPECIES: cell wall metabolism sensor histidine kinase WalK [Bacillus]MBJ7886066.1 cell wall metabolism sensor histidine kinase WalK [Bacillaceae bacterium HSR45]MBY8348631.1 cell wall metabolism sensor histidine kinase WalK [Bacillus sp. PCH94]MDP4082712.1 cell wall metabolism sensor histidine kinase WalK [Bacillota bacterium]AKQ75602.1 two-component sensor histidine kinase [Bacillus licheniformis WX-02]AMR12617.1 PAS domain-containing sensor histidine kinase [Bacillus licheniformis]